MWRDFGRNFSSTSWPKRPPDWRANIDVILGVISEMTGTTKPLQFMIKVTQDPGPVATLVLPCPCIEYVCILKSTLEKSFANFNFNRCHLKRVLLLAIFPTGLGERWNVFCVIRFIEFN